MLVWCVCVNNVNQLGKYWANSSLHFFHQIARIESLNILLYSNLINMFATSTSKLKLMPKHLTVKQRPAVDGGADNHKYAN